MGHVIYPHLFLAQKLVPGGVLGHDKLSRLILFPSGIELASPSLVKKTMGPDRLSFPWIWECKRHKLCLRSCTTALERRYYFSGTLFGWSRGCLEGHFPFLSTFGPLLVNVNVAFRFSRLKSFFLLVHQFPSAILHLCEPVACKCSRVSAFQSPE